MGPRASVRARSYHTSPGRCKASVLCTSLWMIQANTLFSGCPVVDERGCGKVDKGQVASRASVGKFALSTSGRRIHSAACEFRYLQRRMCPLTFCFSGVADAQLRLDVLVVRGCLGLGQGADGCRRCRHGCRQRYRPTFRPCGGESERVAVLWPDPSVSLAFPASSLR
jgi:hypothetical protein